MRRLRDFASINTFFSEREIDELQADIDARRQAREEAPPDDLAAGPTTRPRPGLRARGADDRRGGV